MPDSSFAVPFAHRLRFTSGAFDAGAHVLDDLLDAAAAADGRPARVLVALDDGLRAAAPGLVGRIEGYLAERRGRVEAAGPIVSVPGGEVCKNDRGVLDRIMAALQRARLCRKSLVIAVGGGAVLDVVGFAASTFHRGVRLIRVPTTTLAQGDSGVGVKSAVNLLGVKNLVGAFGVPWGVVNDEGLLVHLSDEHWRGGFSEAVKVALMKDASFYGTIRERAGRLRGRDIDGAVPIIRRSAVLHLEHITNGGDPFETRHARPLDYGHWSAHKLESMTGFALSHGYAVSIGVALDTVYSEMAGHAPAGLGEEVASCLADIGLPVWHPALGRTQTLLEGLEEFREHLGGRLTITLVRAPGETIDVHEIDRGKMERAAGRLRELAGAGGSAGTVGAHPGASPSEAPATAGAKRRYAG